MRYTTARSWPRRDWDFLTKAPFSSYKEMSTAPPSRDTFIPNGYGLEVGQLGNQGYVGHVGGTIGFISGLYHFPYLDLNVAICTDAYAAFVSVGPTALVVQDIVNDAVARN